MAPPLECAKANRGRALASPFSLMVAGSKAGPSSAAGELLLEEASAVVGFLPGAMAVERLEDGGGGTEELLTQDEGRDEDGEQ